MVEATILEPLEKTRATVKLKRFAAVFGMYVKQLELTRFKSFGSTTTIPLLPGFTVVSGPNGSGKSNILDALLFALGLSSSRGMRAEKLLDLVHSGSLERGNKRVETSVSVIFELGSGDPNPLDESEADSSDESVNGSINGSANGSMDISANGSANESPHGATHAATTNSANGSKNGRSASEWKVTRRLRVTRGSKADDQSNTTSTFYINDVPCTLAELHEQLETMRVYPNGYNVVLQGDVTSIISMNAKERRQIIDELAGVATFDRKITQANTKLEAVREQIDRFRLIEQELQANSERLLQECEKAKRYQHLRDELNNFDLWQIVLTWRHLNKQIQDARTKIAEFVQQQTQTQEQIQTLRTELTAAEAALKEIQTRIHALGEDEYLQMQTQAATQQAQLQQWQNQIQSWEQECQQAEQTIQQAQQQQQQLDQELIKLEQQQQNLQKQIESSQAKQQQQQSALATSRSQLQTLAQSSDAWVKQQRYLTRQLSETREAFDPLQQEQIRLTERLHQLERQERESQQERDHLQSGSPDATDSLQDLQTAVTEAETHAQSLATELSQLQAQLEIDQATSQRLQAELHSKQRQLDKLETRRQVLQDTQGSRAAQLILSTNLMGVCGLVAQLGQVDPRYQLALEIAAGSRLNHIVVEDEEVATVAINLLKREKAGRATFLPLNTLKPIRPPGPMNAPGAVDYALRLVQFEDRFCDVFGFVFGQTVVFESLDQAKAQIGRYRMVTLEGELLETSGAMSGGSPENRSSLHFGATESAEADSLKQRLQDIEDLLHTLVPRIQAAQTREKELTEAMIAARRTALEAQQRFDRQQTEVNTRQARLDQLQQLATQQSSEHQQIQDRLIEIEAELEPLSNRIADLTTKLGQLEESPVNQHWQQIQDTVQHQEAALTEIETSLRELDRQGQGLITQQELNRAKHQQQQERQHEQQDRLTQRQDQIRQQQEQIEQLNQQMAELQTQITAAEARLASLRQERDQQEFQVRTQQQNLQRLEWECHNAFTQQQEKEALLAQLNEQIQSTQAQLPDPMPEVPDQMTLDDLQRRRRRTEDKIKALEPVNMLAITEYEQTQERLQDLTQKLATLNEERTELLLRIENFATLRRQAFMEAFETVDQHFRTIFAQLSDGDGHLELENREDPLAGGLTLVAHPKGKPVKRLNSMSGGEKSLTALSFIFALQRYRPSCFYAFDEVDMFLDGANVEKLAAMVWQQSQQAQFIVVSLRRPMIERADRTIGVTQARGAYTQVIGLKNR